MKNKIDLKKFFGAMKNTPVAKEDFLKSLRERLILHIKLNPPLEKEGSIFNKLFWLKPLLTSFIFGLIALTFAGATLVYSHNALPGETFYPVKLLSEKIRLAAELNAQTKTDLRLDFAQKRIVEMEKVLDEPQKEQAKNINRALNNFDTHVGKVSEEARNLKEKGELEKAFETNANLKKALEIYKKNLQASKEKIDQKEGKEAVERVLDSVDNLSLNVEKEINNIDEKENERAKELGFEQAAQGKIAAAQNKIEEVEKFVNEKKVKLEGIEDAKNNLDEAKKLLDGARTLYDAQKYEEAFEKGKESFQAASFAKTLVKISANSQNNSQNKVNVEDTKDNKDLKDSIKNNDRNVNGGDNEDEHKKDDK